MTNEEAIKAIKAHCYFANLVPVGKEALDMAIKALEQEPCEDTISRADAVKVASGYCHPANIAKELAKLPPVTPIRPKGHWFYDKSIENWRCSECNETPKTMGYCGSANFMAKHFKFCNHCGVRMVEPQESEG
jgi:hypothetical protein